MYTFIIQAMKSKAAQVAMKFLVEEICALCKERGL